MVMFLVPASFLTVVYLQNSGQATSSVTFTSFSDGKPGNGFAFYGTCVYDLYLIGVRAVCTQMARSLGFISL